MTTRILVVDDEPRYVRLMEANLTTEGFQVLKAYDGQNAVEIVAEKQPDLVLLDVMMPGLNGFSACERIREFSNVRSLWSPPREKNRIESEAWTSVPTIISSNHSLLPNFWRVCGLSYGGQ